MMSFCKKSVHSLLGLSSISMNFDPNSSPHHSKCLLDSSIGLITATHDSFKPPHVLASSAVKSSPPFAAQFKKDPGGIGFLDDVGGGVNGLMSCTESLGFESYDERRSDDEIELLCCSDFRTTSSSSSSRVSNWRRNYERRREVKKFPPPLSSFNHNGQPCFFLRPFRQNGRLELTEIRIDRPEIFRASREDGRLRLHLIRDDDDDEEEEDEDEFCDVDEETEIPEEEEDRSGEWKFPVAGEGFQRCHDMVPHPHHHHNLHVWRQHCVTTR